MSIPTANADEMSGTGRRLTSVRELPAEVAAAAPEWAGWNLYTSPRWMHALLEGYPRFEPGYTLLWQGDKVTGFLPWIRARQYGFRELLSMPFGTYGGPVLSPHADPRGIRALAADFRARAREARTVRFDLILPRPPAEQRVALEEELGGAAAEASALVLDLTPGAEVLWRGYRQQLRRSVRRAQDAGVTVVDETDTAESADRAWDEFFRLYSEQSQTHDVTWHHSRRCLDAVRKHLGGDARVWLARHQGRVVAGQLALAGPDGELILWLSGSLPQARPVYAFHLLVHRVVEHAAAAGLARCNFGSSMSKSGVEEFKRSFGTEERPLLRFYHQPRWVDWVQKARWS